MDIALFVKPLPFPEVFSDLASLKLILGLAMFLAGLLVFSIWREHLLATKEDDKARFLIFNLTGGSWILAIFSVCGGIYFLFDSILKWHA